MVIDLLILLFLVGLNGFFSMSEMAVVSSRSARLQAIAESDRAAQGPRVAAKLREHPERFLSTVQVGITLVGVLSGAVGAATVSEPLAEMLVDLPYVGPSAEPVAFGVVVVVITVMTLILGELVPKRIALTNPERIASSIARPMQGLASLFSPVVSLLGFATDGTLRILGISAENTSQVTEEEIRHLVAEGAEAGAIDDVERDIVHRVFKLGDKLAYDIMTPRRAVPWLDIDAPLGDNVQRIREAQAMRYVVGRADGRDPVGVLRAEDLLADLPANSNINLFAGMAPPLYVPETAKALSVLGLMQAESKFMALVVDEHGEVQGAITMADIFRAMIGNVSGETRSLRGNITPRSDGSFLVDGGATVDEMKDVLGLRSLPGEETEDFATVAGAMLHYFERLPSEGDHFVWDGYRFEVMDIDGTRIDKIMITPLRNLPIGAARAR